MTSIRKHYRLTQAAQHGDRSAFERIWQEAEEPLGTAVRQTLTDGHVPAPPDRIREVLTAAHDCSFEELCDKPADWSTYGWLSWITRREALNRVGRDR